MSQENLTLPQFELPNNETTQAEHLEHLNIEKIAILENLDFLEAIHDDICEKETRLTQLLGKISKMISILENEDLLTN